MARDIDNKLSVDGSEVYGNAGSGKGLELEINHTQGVISGFTILKAGVDYASGTYITIKHPTGKGAICYISSVGTGGEVTAIVVTEGGSGYYTEGKLRQASTIMATLVELDWWDVENDAAAPLYFTDACTNIRWYTDTSMTSYNTFMGIGALGSIDSVEEGFDLQAYGISITLSGIPLEVREQAFADITFKTAFQNRSCKVYTAFLDTEYNIMGDPILIFAGQMDGCTMSVSDSVSITIGVQSRLINWEIPRGGRYNSNDQKVWYPEDTGFDLIPELLNKELDWGGDGSGNDGNLIGRRTRGRGGGGRGRDYGGRRTYNY